MKLSVKNLGPIKLGEIDLSKRFYVFVGYNNSGKTYMSQTLWSLWDFEGVTNSHISILHTDMLLLMTYKEIDNFEMNKWGDGTTILSLTIKHIESFFQFYYRNIKERVVNNFNTNKEASSFSNLELSFIDDVDIFKKQAIKRHYGLENYCYTYEKPANSLEINITKAIKDTIDPLPLQLDYTDKAELPSGGAFIYAFITSAVSIDPKQENLLCLPADRAFYTSYYKYIYAGLRDEMRNMYNALKKMKNGEKLDPPYEQTYTSSVDKLLSSIYNLNLKTPKASVIYQDLMEELQRVIGGDIVTKSSNPDISSLATFKLRMENDEELSMHLSSSSVTQLTALFLYLKYWATESNNILIIDEPEENLHPRNQIAVLNILMKFANRNNNRVILTTHSPLMTDAVNNYLHLGYLADKYGKDTHTLIQDNHLDMDADAALSHDEIGIYFFDGKSIRSYSVEEYGADFRDFREEQEKIAENGDTLRGLILKEKKSKIQEQYKKTTADV